MEKHFYCFDWIVLYSLLFAAVVSSNHHGNPANDIVDVINKNRTAVKLQPLSNSAGLGCMALQYVEECEGNCTSNNTFTCQPTDLDFIQVFAPNCGVELPTLGTITGHIIGCQHKYLNPPNAFSQVLARDIKTMSLMRNKTHSEVGVGFVRDHHRGEYYWCVLFSDGPWNSSFVLEDLGQGIKQKSGCFSGTGILCSRGQEKTRMFLELVFALCFLYILVFF